MLAALPAPLRAVVWCARAWGLAPYLLEQSGLYAASERLRALSVAVSLAVMGGSLYFFLGFSVELKTDLDTVAMTIWRVMEVVQSVVLCPLLWWRLHPTLLPLLNADPVRLGAALVPLRYAVVAGLTTSTVAVVSVTMWTVTYGRYDTLAALLYVALCGLCFTNQVTVTTYFAFLVHALGRRFALLNAILTRYLGTLRRRRARRTEREAVFMKGGIASVRRDHARARAALDTLCHCFGLTLALQGIADFWHLVAFVYLAVNKNIPLAMSLSQAVWCFGYCVRWSYVFAASSYAMTKGNETMNVLSEFISECSELATQDELSEVQMSCLLLHQQPVRVTVSGGVEISDSLLWQVAAACVTYVVILMQFHES